MTETIFGNVITLKDFKDIDGMDILLLKIYMGHIARFFQDNYKEFQNIKIINLEEGIRVRVLFKDKLNELDIKGNNLYYLIGKIKKEYILKYGKL